MRARRFVADAADLVLLIGFEMCIRDSIEEKEKRGTLRLRGAFFAISDGVLHILDEKTGEFSPA